METFIQFLSYAGIMTAGAFYLYRRERSYSARYARSGFFVSVALYIISFVFGDGALLDKIIMTLPRDLAVFVVLMLVFNRFAPRPKIFFFMIFAVVSSLGMLFYGKTAYQNYIAPQFDCSAGECGLSAESKECQTMMQCTTNSVKLSPSGELLLDLSADKQPGELKTVLTKYNIRMEPAFPELANEAYSDLEEYFVLDIPSNALNEIETIRRELMATGAVDFIEDNEVVSLDQPLVDELEINRRNPKYGTNDPALDKLWGFEAMNVDELYKMIKSGKVKAKKKAKIAILDTGVDGEHEDLKANFKSIESRYDKDKLGHGTHCAGIAAAVSNNGKGIASFSPNSSFVEVTSVKVLSDRGFGSQRSIIKGIIKAADSKADVISLSLGGRSTDASRRAYSEAVKYANKAGAIVIVAAGNSNANAKDFGPANAEGVITVAAIDPSIKRASFSNYVQDVEMGISAPGVNIYSTTPGSTYKIFNGTSMATPYVAGLVGIMKAVNPELNTKQAYEILKTTGRDTNETKRTGKFIQADKATAKLVQ